VSNLLSRVEESVRAKKLFREGESVLIAVSGGLDSMVLLHLLARLTPAHHWRLAVAHFNHQLRGRSSHADQHLVEQTAKKLGLPFVAGRADVRAFASRRGESIEMAARELRHKFLAKTALRRKIRVIALAHHADDQVELFFLRLLRGAGVEGLAGMKWRNPSPANSRITLARPWLAEPKAALQAWAARENIPFREDASNALPDIRRNRIRHELLPLLAGKYQPALGQVILRQMEIFAADAVFVNLAASKWLESKSPSKFEKLPVAVQRSCLQLQLAQKGVLVNFDLIEQIRAVAGRPVAISTGKSVLRDAAGRIQVGPARKPGFSRRQTRRQLTGRAGEFLFDNVRITWEIGPLAAGTVRAAKNGVNSEHFDADKVGHAIGLRHWRPGDRFQPIGMAGGVKLQDLFTNRKIPRAERRGLVVATTAAGDLFWVEGLRLAERFKLDKNTVRGLKWCWERLY
jgi:tRNA(Ile)-lysidine synthase